MRGAPRLLERQVRSARVDATETPLRASTWSTAFAGA
jgi:hypothetical protein